MPTGRIIRDPKYLAALREERCIVTGLYGTPDDPVEAVHIGTAGKGIKTSDDEALPIRHSIHAEMHRRGEMTVLRERLADGILRLFARAYARERYRHRQAEQTAERIRAGL